jgi:hypothetical protein
VDDDLMLLNFCDHILASLATSDGGHCRQGTGAYMIRAVVGDGS